MAEKSLASLPRELRMLYTKGFEAMQRDNFDYAADLFTQVLGRDPSYFEVRKALRVAQSRKAGVSRGFFKKMWSSAGSSPLLAKAQVALRTNPAEALATAEQILNNDPESQSAHRVVVDAARTLELPYTAMLSLEVLFRHSPRNKDVAIQFANSLAENGDAKLGETILTELYRTNPTDNDLAQALKNISARNTLSQGGYESLADGEGSYRDILKNKAEAISLEQQNRQVRTEDTADRLIREYEARLANEPRNAKLLRDLGDLYGQKKQYDRALEYLCQLRDLSQGGDAAVERAITETTLKKYEHQITAVDPESPERDELVARIQAEKQAYELGEAQRRVEKNPSDLQMRYELGVLYFEQGKTGEAIQELQKAQANPHRKVAAMNYLAQCFARRKMYDLAVRTLQGAIKEKPVLDDEKKDLIYNLGSVFESMGKKEEAVEQYKLIYEVDIGYRDVGKKVDDYYASLS